MACLMCAQCDLEVVEFSLTLCLFAAEAYLNGFCLASPGIWRASLATNTAGELPLISLPSARTCFSGTCVHPLGRLRGFLRARCRRVARTSCENATWASGPRANGRAVEPSTLPPVRAVAFLSAHDLDNLSAQGLPPACATWTVGCSLQVPVTLVSGRATSSRGMACFL